jgi:hypothetical protein
VGDGSFGHVWGPSALVVRSTDAQDDDPVAPGPARSDVIRSGLASPEVMAQTASFRRILQALAEPLVSSWTSENCYSVCLQ